MADEVRTRNLTAIDGTITFTNPTLASMHMEADLIQSFIAEPANLMDPAALTERLNEGDVWMARLTDILIKAKGMKEYARSVFLRDNEDRLAKMTATNSNRLISTYLFEFNVTADRLEQLYQTLTVICRDLVTQISFVKKQMEMR